MSTELSHSQHTDGQENNTHSSPTEKTGGNLIKRTAVGLFLAVGTISLIILGVLPFSIEVMVMALIAVFEFYDLAERKGIRPSRANGVTAVILLVFTAFLGKDEYVLPLLVGLVMIPMLTYLFRKEFHVSSFLDVGVTLLGFLYVGWFFSYIIFIRKIEGAPFSFCGFGMERGAGLVLILLFSNSLTDVGAFFVGKAIGKHKLAPHISPKKTVEGSIGGLLGALCGAFMIGLPMNVGVADLLVMGLICGIFAQLGDLWESILKRDVHVKDAGYIVAGHGGMLDRIDSMLFSAPMFYFYIIYFYK